MFDTDGERVVLIRKAKPEWQAGKLNGVGGKIEDAEDRPVQAMVREFREEAGVDTEEKDWTPFHLAMFRDPTGLPSANIYFFKMFSDDVFNAAATQEKEPIVKVDLLSALEGGCEIIPNLKWLLPLAQDPHVTHSYTTDWDGTAIQPLKRAS